MSWIQLVQIVLSVKGRIGYCLEYARMAFGAPAIEPNAWKAWNATKFKHLDRNFPSVCVPVWFSYVATIQGVRDNYGHVAVWVPGVGFYSSPWQSGTDHAVLKSIEEIEQKYTTKNKQTGEIEQVRFVGWSEDISNVRVAKGGNPMNWEDIKMFKGWLGLPVNEGDKGFIGMEPRAFMFAIVQGKEYQDYLKGLQNGQGKVTKQSALDYIAANLK